MVSTQINKAGVQLVTLPGYHHCPEFFSVFWYCWLGDTWPIKHLFQRSSNSILDGEHVTGAVYLLTVM